MICLVFRGFYAPASLKLDLSGKIHGLPEVFRGFYAPASLKQVKNIAGLNSRQSVFRGFYAPASLKLARIQQVEVQLLGVFSGVFMPRPH